MNTHLNLDNILIKQYTLISHINEVEDTYKEKNAYYNAYLLSNFGIIVDKPNLLTWSHVKLISSFLHLEVPKSFYGNPQNMKYFTSNELLVEQIVSYFTGYGTDLGRIEIFKKDLPQYVVSDELVLRKFKIVSLNEAKELAKELMKNYCSYTRPFSIVEKEEVLYLYNLGYYTDYDICCKDNVMLLYELNPMFARFLDKKDLVKLSIMYFGETDNLIEVVKKNQYKLNKIKISIDHVKDCPMSKKQAKYFNKLRVICGKESIEKATNNLSPDKLAKLSLDRGDVLEAARIYSKSGSMLERRLVMLLSRATEEDAIEILELLPCKSPIVLYQLLKSLSNERDKARTFSFYKNNRLKYHIETEYEKKWKKTVLKEELKNKLFNYVINKIKVYYSNLPKLGKAYIEDKFYKLGLPINTSASGSGLDVLPLGSRVKLTGDNIRTFVHWKNAMDIDSSLIIVDENGKRKKMDFTNYYHKFFGDSILFSGDVTSKNGAEYFDIRLNELEEKGYKYIVQEFHGYGDDLNKGEIYAGYQNKNDLNTKAWDPKNIAMQYQIKGDSHAAMAFAIDIKDRELVILNLILDSDSIIANDINFKIVERVIDSSYLDVNMGFVAECRGEVTNDLTEANIVFSDTYEAQGEQIVYKSNDISKLVSFINE